MKDSAPSSIVEFSGFRLDQERRRLIGPDGAGIPLKTKAFDVLAYLAAKPGCVIDKHELLDAVWPGVAVEENTLNQAISAVRRALGDLRTEPRFIATIQGRGYQFVAPVQEVNADAAPEQHLDFFDSRRFGSASLIAGILGLAAVAVVIAGYFRSPGDAVKYEVGRTLPLTHESMLELYPAASPDGRFIAYAAGPIGRTDILVRDEQSGEIHNLTEGLPGAHGWPRWSPEGDRIAFRTVSPQSLDVIHVIPARGGEAVPVVREPFLTGHDWSPEGTDIVYTRASSLYIYSLAEGAPRRLPATIPEAHSPAWSPDGSRIALVSDNSQFVFGTDAFANIASSAIWVVSADGSESSQITDEASLNTSPVWARDSRSLFFLSDRDEAQALYHVVLPRSGKELPVPEFLTRLDAHTINLSADGNALIYSEYMSKVNIWSLPIPDVASVPVVPVLDMATQITSGNQIIEGMDLSSDGRWLLFDSNRRGNMDIYKLDLSQNPIGEPIQLTVDRRDDFSAIWSPDDTSIAFHSLRTGNRDIFVMSADGDDLQQLTFDSAEDRHPHWSPDGNQIVFVSERSGPMQLFTISRREHGGGWTAPEQVTYDWGWFPKWSPSDRLIAYTALGNGSAPTIALLEMDKDSTTFDLGPDLDGSYPVWSPDGSKIYFKGISANEDIGIWSIRPDSSDLVKLISFKELSPSGQPRLEFTASDSHFFFTLPEQDSDIKMLELVELER